MKKELETQRPKWLRLATIFASGLGATVFSASALMMSGTAGFASFEAGVFTSMVTGLSALAAAGSAHAYFAGTDDANESYMAMIRRDSTTGLLSRDGLAELLPAYVREGKITKGLKRTFLISFEFDSLREINDTFGIDVGDKLLTVLAQRLTRMMGDAGPIAHTGGAEFVVALRTMEDEMELHAVVNALLDALARPVRLGSNSYTVFCNAGVYELQLPKTPLDDALRCANLARANAREAGRGTWAVYHPEMGHAASYRKWIESELSGAMKRGEFSVRYQPQVRVTNGETEGYEALLRWTHHEVGAVPPSEFIPVAERCGMVTDIGNWVLRQACKDMKVYFPDKKVSVNVAVSQLEQPTFMADLRAVLNECGTDTSKLELEVTETMLIRDLPTVRKRFDDLHALGISIAIDDFGTGYSNLATLSQISFDKLKIDKSFIDRLHGGQKDCALVAAIVNLARSIEVDVIAEGIETDKQSKLVEAAGCTLMQGYLYGKPQSVKQIIEKNLGELDEETAGKIVRTASMQLAEAV